jgi:hypothetical protein
MLGLVELKLCQRCKRPFLAEEETCPQCEQHSWDQDSWMNFGCLIATVLPLFIILLFWLLFVFGIFLR